MPDFPKAAVRAAAEAMQEEEDTRTWPSWERLARIALEAAAPILGAQARRDAAAHILAVDALLCGLRCPCCHAETRGAVSVRLWECTNGHRYGRGGGHNSGDTLMTALRRLAEHDELPLMPPRRPSTAEGVLEQARQIGEDRGDA